jgi:hypothetical protein
LKPVFEIEVAEVNVSALALLALEILVEEGEPRPAPVYADQRPCRGEIGSL